MAECEFCGALQSKTVDSRGICDRCADIKESIKNNLILTVNILQRITPRRATHYVSLVGPLLGLYLPLPGHILTQGLLEARIALNTSKLKSLWGNIYTKEEAEKSVNRYGGKLLPDSFTDNFDYDTSEYHKVLKKATGRDV